MPIKHCLMLTSRAVIGNMHLSVSTGIPYLTNFQKEHCPRNLNANLGKMNEPLNMAEKVTPILIHPTCTVEKIRHLYS